MKSVIFFVTIQLSILGLAESASAQYPILDFGQVAVGQFHDDSIPVSNPEMDTQIYFGLVLPPPFYWLDHDSVRVNPLDSNEFHFRFEPTVAGRDSLVVFAVPGKPVLFIGTGVASSVDDPSESAPSLHFISYPNPASSSLTISYDLLQSGRAVLTLYDMSGNEIATLADEHEASGKQVHTIRPEEFPSGHYLCRLHAVNANGETTVTSCKVTIEH